MSTRAAFVVGASGFVGSNTVRALLDAGWIVHTFGPSMRDDQLADVSGAIHAHEGSVADREGLEAAMVESGAEVVVSFAAFSSGSVGLARSGESDAEKAIDINVQGLRHTFDAARATGIGRVVWSSSTTLYGPSHLYPDQPIDEGAPYRPQLMYGLTKAMGEQLSDFYRDRFGVECVAVRLPLIFGPGLWYQGAAAALLDMFRAARPGAKHELHGPADALDLMYVTDTAEALAAMCGHRGALAGRYNINGFTTNYPEIARAVERAVPGFEARFTETPPAVVYPLISTARAEADLGYAPRFDLDAAVADYMKQLGKT